MQFCPSTELNIVTKKRPVNRDLPVLDSVLVWWDLPVNSQQDVFLSGLRDVAYYQVIPTVQ